MKDKLDREKVPYFSHLEGPFHNIGISMTDPLGSYTGTPISPEMSRYRMRTIFNEKAGCCTLLFYISPLYFRRVAWPPRICRCCLLVSSTCRTCS